MTVTTMSARMGEFLLSEAPGTLSRESIVVAAGAGNLAAGTVLGKITKGAVTVGTPAFTGTGNGTCTLADPAYGSGVQDGTYIVRLLEGKADGGNFEVRRPDGTIDGYAVAGTAYAGQVKFTIADGATDFSNAAQFTIAVSIAAGSGQYKAFDDDNTDGSETASGVLLCAVDAASAAQDAVMIARLSEVSSAKLVWASTNDSGDKASGLADLAALNIIARS